MPKTTFSLLPKLRLIPRLRVHAPLIRDRQLRFSVILAVVVSLYAISQVSLSPNPGHQIYYLIVFGSSVLTLLGYRFLSRPDLVLFTWMLSLITLETVRGSYSPTLYMTFFAWLPLAIGLTIYLAGVKLGGLFTAIALGQALWTIKFSGTYASRSPVFDPDTIVRDLQMNLLAAEIVGGLAIYWIGLIREQSENELEQRRIARSTAVRMNAVRGILGHVAHELNNPLAIIHSCVVQYKSEVSGGPLSVERQLFFRKCMDDAYARIHRVSHTLSGFTDDAIEGSKTVVFFDLYREAIGNISAKVVAHDLTIMPGGRGLHEQILCRPQEVILVLTTLLDILSEAAGEKNHRKTLRIEVEASKDILSVRLTNSVVATQLEGESHPWSRDRTDSTDSRLNACQRIILEHDGCLGLVEEREGIEFWFELPKTRRD